MVQRTSTALAATLLVLVMTTAACVCGAQTFDFQNSHPQTIKLDGLWRFHTGDDPGGKLGWADPAFDDSSWPLLRSDTNWGVQGFRGYEGLAWYRFKIILPENHTRLAICISQLRSSYEIFANGKLIGKLGGMPPQAKYVIGFDQVFPIPDDLPSGHAVSIAIRVWSTNWLGTDGGPQGVPVLGELGAIKVLKQHNDWGRFWNVASGNVLMLMNLVAAFGGLFLFLMRPGDREYLWFAIYELLTGIEHLFTDRIMFYPTGWVSNWLVDIVVSASSWVFFLIFVFTLLKGRRNWLFWSAVGTAAAASAATVAATAHWISDPQWRVIWLFTLLPYFVCILALLYRRATQGVADAQLLIVPVAICYGSWAMLIVLAAFASAGQTWVVRDWNWYFQLSSWPFPFSVQDIADMVMLLAVLAVLPLRFARSRRDEERLSAEMESARTVQQVLIPAEIPTIPGFDIHCVYRPAGQVGGDFFQIIPIDAGGTLIAIGDVSGKGMPAAMTVSLLVGTLRTLAHYTQSPAEILAAMNQRMLARSQGGFTTCLVLRVAADGAVTFANAGHLAPYAGGREIELENGLPLGLVADAVYAETIIHFPENAQLTLVTDGVVEARNRTGELLGFARAAGLSTQTAESIADAAQAFGQEDDITVMTLLRSSTKAEPGPESSVAWPSSVGFLSGGARR